MSLVQSSETELRDPITDLTVSKKPRSNQSIAERLRASRPASYSAVPTPEAVQGRQLGYLAGQIVRDRWHNNFETRLGSETFCDPQRCLPQLADLSQDQLVIIPAADVITNPSASY